MATVYIQPGTGTGSGTLEDPYFYSELSTAETNAGSGGTILFTDGVYEFTGDAELKADGVIYKSQNHLGATLKRNIPGGLNYVAVSDAANAVGSIIEGFYIQDLHINIFPANDPTATNIPKVINIKQHDTAPSDSVNLISKTGDEDRDNYRFSVEGSEFKYIGPASPYIRPFSKCSSGDMKNCTIYMDLSAATGISNRASAHWRSLENTIISSNNSLNNPISYRQATTTNCCFHNMGPANVEGGVNNINADPLFIDADNSDFRLRPNSPVIGGISSGSSEEKWIKRATLENKTYAFFDPNATGTGDGSSSANACTDIHEAVAAVDFGGYIFVPDMDYTFSGGSIRITKPVKIQALNPGKAIWRTNTSMLTLSIYPTGYQFGINVSSVNDSDTISGPSVNAHTKNIDGYYTGSSFSTSSAVTGDEVYNIVNHSFDGTNHTFTLDRPIMGTLSGSVTFYEEIFSNEDSAIRDMVLVDFNTPTSSNGNGVGFQIYSKNNTTAASTACGSMIFERNSILQTYNINANNKTGFHIRNDHSSVISVRYKVQGNTFSLKNYPGSGGNRVYPHNLGSSYLNISDAEKRFCSNNSYYFYSNVDSNPDYGTGFNQGSNSIWVIESEYGYTSSSHNGDTLSEGNYAYGVNNANLSINPFVNGFDGDLRVRPNSELIGGKKAEETNGFYVDFDNGNDANDGLTLENAFATISAAHAASAHLDTIIIANKTVSLSNNLTLPAGRKYKPLNKCTIDGADSFYVEITDSADVDTYVTGFNFKRLRGANALIYFSGSSDQSLIAFDSCQIEGIITATTSSSALGGTSGAACRPAREGSFVRGCTFDVGWTTTIMTSGNKSSSFVALDRTDLISCTFWVKDTTALSNTQLYLVGQGGQGAWSHGPPLGPVEVKNCIIHGNGRMSYGPGAGDGSYLGFVSNVLVTVGINGNANYVIHSSCLYDINGTPMEINNYYFGSIINDRSIPIEWVENVITEDPKLVDPANSNFQLKPNSPLIGKGK